MRKIVLVLLISILLIGGVSAQKKSEKRQGGTARGGSAQNTEVSEAKPARSGEPVATPGEGRRWSFYVTLSNLFDSNINHDQGDLDSFGLVGGTGIYFRNRPERPTFEFNYEIGQHAYTRTDRWDRTSQALRVRSERSLGRRFVSETSGEISLKGTTEDRELTNRFSLKQGFQFRLTRSNRFNVAGAYRVKRYTERDRGQNSINPYLEGGYERRFGGGRKLEASYRYENNRSQKERFRYIRWTYGVEFTTPFIKQGLLDVEVRYRPQKYARLVEIELPNDRDIEVPRRDRRWIFSAEWKRHLWHGLELGLLYKFEDRKSNNLGRNFRAHAAGAAFTYRWWK